MDPEELDTFMRSLVVRAHFEGFHLSDEEEPFSCEHYPVSVTEIISKVQFTWIRYNNDPPQYSYTLCVPERFFKPNTDYLWMTERYTAACCRLIEEPHMLAATNMDCNSHLMFISDFINDERGAIPI